MTIGISIDDLLKIDPWQYDNQQDLLNAILDQCTELNQWKPIEQAPKDLSERLKEVTCPQCLKEFQLIWNDYSDKKQTLILRGCPSGGIYDVRIKCPHCDYEEEL